jgi:hypothetical protein
MADTDYFVPPTGNQTNGIYELFGYIGGDATGGLFWAIMLLVIWVIAFMGLKQYSTSRAFTFASFMCAVIGIVMGVMDYISPRWMYLAVFMTVIGFVWLKLEGSE